MSQVETHKKIATDSMTSASSKFLPSGGSQKVCIFLGQRRYSCRHRFRGYFWRFHSKFVGLFCWLLSLPTCTSAAFLARTSDAISACTSECYMPPRKGCRLGLASSCSKFDLCLAPKTEAMLQWFFRHKKHRMAHKRSQKEWFPRVAHNRHTTL